MSFRVEGVSVRFGQTSALKDVSCVFQPGRITAVTGGDGAGKSTLLKLLAGAVKADLGSYRVPQKSDIGVLPTSGGVWNNLSVWENLEFVGRAYDMSPDDWQERGKKLLEYARLHDVKERVAGHLSGGMRQKLGFIMATLHRPRLLLLDEPTTGVDPVSRNEMWRLLTAAAAEGAAVVFSTTYLDEAERAHQLLLLHEGSVIASGTPQSVLDNTPGTIYRAHRTDAPAGIFDKRDMWTRGNYVYVWTKEPGARPPQGFSEPPLDLETASIAFLLYAQGGAASSDASPVSRLPSRHEKTTNPLVEARNITHYFGTFTALEDVSLTVNSGEIVGLVGGNGAGKTTLLRILLGAEQPTAGECSLIGLRPSLDARKHVGYVAQGMGLYPTLSAQENIQFAASIFGVTVPPDFTQITRRFEDAPVGSLPLGTQRMISFLTANVHNPQLLVLDEPTSGMDPLRRKDLWQQMHAVCSRGAGILVTTHYMDEAIQCDRLVLLAGGRVVAEGTADRITAGLRSIVVNTPRWQRAIELLEAEGIPASLAGRTIRAPNVDAGVVLKALQLLKGDFVLHEEPSTLEEAMLTTQHTR
ncbi:MAG: ATP-binding cassette domain-containing protein [Actinomycetaceae bacterium]|nr:ATP-binding cassette domain-containing protein [Actinomycetaceae bacterium]